MSKYKVEEVNTDYVTVSDKLGNTVTVEGGMVSYIDIVQNLSVNALKMLITNAKLEYIKNCTTL